MLYGTRDRTRPARAPLARARRLAAWALCATVATVLAACGGSVPDSAGRDDLRIEVVQGAVAPSARVEAKDLEGSVVAGTITVMVKSAPRITGVAFFLDDVGRREAAAHVATVAPYAWEIDTTTLADGAHTLTVATSVQSGRPPVLTAAFTVRNGPAGPGPFEPLPADPQPQPPSQRTVPPATLYVATNGSDANDGRSVTSPLRSLQRAADVARPGDTVYIRGGVYPIQVGFNTSGTAELPITWTSFPGEWAILDGGDQTPVTSQHRVWITNVRFNHFLNFEVRYGPQNGIFIRDSSDNLFSNVVTHGNHYSGILVLNGHRNRFEYVLTYDNYDQFNPSGRAGDDADGISISTGDGNVLYRVFAFRNSDDGIDTWRSTNTVVDSSVAFDNGRGAYGNGNGIKAGGNNEVVNTVVRNSIAFDNRSNGFDENSGRNVTFFNNTSYNNGGFSFVAGSSSRLHNNIAFGSPLGNFGATASHNSWNLGIDDPRFVSTHRHDPAFLALQADSPALGVGSSLGTHTDLGAIPRGLQYAHVIGATLPQPTETVASR